MLRRTFALLAVAAMVAWAGSVTALADEKPGTHEGKVVKAERGKLTMTDKEGKNEHTHMVPLTAKVTIDGKDAKVEDLKVGSKVKVTTAKEGEKLVVTKIEGTKGD